jgi:hypothetical protein
VRERVTVSYRGANYEIGRGRDYYAIWAVGGPRSQPAERWPVTRDGWFAAWARFTSIEAPGAISPVRPRPALPGSGLLQRGPGGAATAASALAAVALLAVGVALGIASLFPSYTSGASLAQQPAELVPHVIYLAAWTAGAALILLGGARLRIGALLGLGTSIVTFGLFFSELGTVIAGGAHLLGAGLVLGLLGWLACAAGSVLALRLQPGGQPLRQPGTQPPGQPAEQPGGQPAEQPGGHPAPNRGLLGAFRPGGPLGGVFRRPRGPEVGAAVILILAALGTAAAFAPSWDSFTFRTLSGTSQTLAQGNAFANPAPVIVGDVAVMVAVVAAAVAAALWRPARHGAVLLAGAIIPMAAQAISALIQSGEPATPEQFGISPAQAQQAGLTISSGLTSAFWLYCVFLIALAVSAAWLMITSRPAAPGAPAAPAAPAGLAGPAPVYSPQPPPSGAGHPTASASVPMPSSE